MSIGQDSAFPIWTELVNTSTTPSGSPSGQSGRARGDASLASLSEILGWRINKNDPDGIRRALGEAFTVTRDDDGKAELSWNQRGFRVQVNSSGIAAITGAQRSLYERSRAIVDQIKPLLAGLRALVPSPDAEDVDAIQSLIEPELEQLVEQFGAEGGPVPQRVDHLLDLLMQYDPDADPLPIVRAETVGGQLGVLREDLGLDEARVNTIEEELWLTNFQTLVSYIDMIRTTWHNERSAFDRTGTDAYLGTHAVLIERALTCVAQSVHELTFALDSVFVGPDERATLTIRLGEIDVTFAELFDWIEDVATEDGFDIIRSSGKDGLEYSLAPTLEKLHGLVGEAITFITDDQEEDEPTLPEAFAASRVAAAFSELHKHLGNAARRAAEVVRPAATAATARSRRAQPTSTTSGSTVVGATSSSTPAGPRLRIGDDDTTNRRRNRRRTRRTPATP